VLHRPDRSARLCSDVRRPRGRRPYARRAPRLRAAKSESSTKSLGHHQVQPPYSRQVDAQLLVRQPERDGRSRQSPTALHTEGRTVRVAVISPFQATFRVAAKGPIPIRNFETRTHAPTRSIALPAPWTRSSRGRIW
jgi:hypothetical protein